MSKVIGSTAHCAMCRMAARLYIQRQLREAEPHGDYFLGYGWMPADYERRDCCTRYLRGSRRPSSGLKRHYRSLKHIATVYELPLADVRAALREIRKGE